MSLLIKNAKIIIQGSPYNGKRMDVLIEKGKIKTIKKNISILTKQIIKSKNVCISLGWLDIGVHSGEPGLEHRETLETLERSALSGGYTGVVVMPNTNPCVNSKSELQYFENNKKSLALDYFVIAAASKDCEGKELTEYIDLSKNGAVAFSNGKNTIDDEGFMMRSLQYAKAIQRPILNRPISKSMSSGAHIHEGPISTRLGLKGSPVLAEKLILQRDIELTDYCNSTYISHKISSSDSCKLIRDAKKRVLNISATVSSNNLVFLDEDLKEYDTNLKLDPPLRTKKDQSALIRAIKDDTIDAIVSDHQPIEIEAKKLEFPYAKQGAIGLQTSFGGMWKKLNKKISLIKLIEKISIGPRNILNIELPIFDIGIKPNITIFDPTISWTFQEEDIISKSKNSPWIGKELQGKVLGICNNGIFISQL